MPNLKQAPTLVHEGKKHDEQFYALPQNLMDIIFTELKDKSAQLRIMIVLIGTKPGFKVSEQWILDRTGLQHASYITARKKLVEMGWLKLDAATTITVNIDAIYAKGRSNTVLPQKQSSNTVLPNESNTVLQERSNTVLPIIYNNETDNKKTTSHSGGKRQEFIF